MYCTGYFVAEEDELRQRYVRGKTKTAREGAVQEELIQNQRRVDNVVERAWEYVLVIESTVMKDEQGNDSDYDM